MSKLLKNILIAIAGAGGLYLLYQLAIIVIIWWAFKPCEASINTKRIKSSCGLTNGVTIEEINVDSIASNGRPVIYTINYAAKCYMHHPKGKPPLSPKKLFFKKKGKYHWKAETVDVRVRQYKRYRESIDGENHIMLAIRGDEHELCPIEFKNNQWYYIDFSEPDLKGVYVYINQYGKAKQYSIYSGVSPI